ncbi:MAG: 2-C-methyl-D-erythritol 4-phosphate cytidylyltransferase [Candidatus Omnitrophica bacterium]|nr:2-C-methyl-D-erythritol 4-phosphate cytidylyltransferase [Candidatus Omnitrophota bacterium]
MSFISAVIPAAGYGLRFKTDTPKTLIHLNRKPLFIYPLEIINRHPQIDEIVLVVPLDYLALFKRWLKDYRIKKIKAVIPGGRTRQESVRKGLGEISPECQWVLIHDAVRPFINLRMISEAISSAKRYGAVTFGIPVSSTLKSVDKAQFVKRTLKRDSIWESHTPQVFKKELILEAHRRCKDEAFNDDAGMMERLGIKVKMIRGTPWNLKLTYPEDLLLAEVILKYKKRYGL